MSMSSPEISAGLIRLLRESPIRRKDVATDILDLVRAGEEGLAFEHICSWIYEDDLAIDADYFRRLEAMAEELGLQRSVRTLVALVDADKATDTESPE
jgi:hypothetical protein